MHECCLVGDYCSMCWNVKNELKRNRNLVFNCNGKVWLSFELWTFLVIRNYVILCNVELLLMKECYELCGREIITLNCEKTNDNTSL
jgi:hypothetical protein